MLSEQPFSSPLKAQNSTHIPKYIEYIRLPTPESLKEKLSDAKRAHLAVEVGGKISYAQKYEQSRA